MKMGQKENQNLYKKIIINKKIILTWLCFGIKELSKR